jgi:predicted XRE-type DNA-binding protein
MSIAQRKILDPKPAISSEDEIRGGDDFLLEQGVEDPDEFRVKSHLCHVIASIVEGRELTQTHVADLTGQKQADISRIINYRHDDYSVWRLMKILSDLGADIGIMINPDSGNQRGIILPQTLEAPEETVTPSMSL